MPPAPDRSSSSSNGPVLTGEVIMPGDRKAGASASDQERMVELLALLTDNIFRLPGTPFRFGLDPLIGLFPVIGDLVSAVVSLYIMQAAAQLNVPRSTVARMGVNVAVDYLLGAIPVIGNVFDFWWKANARNVQLLQRAMESPRPHRRRDTLVDWLFIGGVVLTLAAIFVGSLAAAIWTARWLISQLS